VVLSRWQGEQAGRETVVGINTELILKFFCMFLKLSTFWHLNIFLNFSAVSQDSATF